MQSDDPKGTSASDDPASSGGSRKGDAVDFAYLAAQTFGDKELEGELLALFLDQASRLLPALPLREAHERIDMAHLLKGSARAIGATMMAAAMEVYEQADSAAQGESSPAYAAVVATFEETEAAIMAHRTTQARRPA